jgi:hypothetical protein
MAQFNNTMGISEIAFTHTVQCVCAIGKSLCTYDMVVEMVPGKVIPDYLEVQEFMDNEVHMHFLTMEDATAAVANYLDLNYLPVSGTVSCLCDDARHFPVRVTKKIGGNK